MLSRVNTLGLVSCASSIPRFLFFSSIRFLRRFPSVYRLISTKKVVRCLVDVKNNG